MNKVKKSNVRNSKDYTYLLYKMSLKGLTKQDLANKMGLSIASIRYKFNGQVSFTMKDILLINQILGLSDDDIYKCFFEEGVKNDIR